MSRLDSTRQRAEWLDELAVDEISNFDFLRAHRFKVFSNQSARFDHCVLSALRFEMIFRLVKCDADALLQVPQHFFGRSICRLRPGPTAVPPSAISRKTSTDF